MPVDYYITYSLKEKLALLKGLTESILTGQIILVKTSADAETRFDPIDVNNELSYTRLCDSIANDSEFDASDPIQAKCAGNARPGITRMHFGDC